MYDTFQTIAYPFVEIIEPISYERGKALKGSLVDFRLNVYNDSASGVPVVKVYKIFGTANNITFCLKVFNSLNDKLLASGCLTFANDSYATQDFVRYHIDNTDFSDYVEPGYVFEGYFCFNQLSSLIAAFVGAEYGAILTMEPATVAVFGQHRVSEFYCRTAKPLLAQSKNDKYITDPNPVSGAVKLVPGHNCSISVQGATKTIVIAAQRNANDSSTERCGVWSDKISSKDVLCNEVIYSISGVTPDTNGNVKLDAVSPLVCSSLTATEIASNSPELASALSSFQSIIRFIYVGFPQSQGNTSVFNCSPSTT